MAVHEPPVRGFLDRDVMQRVEFFMALEEEFGSVSPSDATERFFTVKDALEFISAKQG